MSESDFTISLSEIGFVGKGLSRPECVLTTAKGDLFTSDRRGGVQHIAPGGRQILIGQRPDVLPNGIARTRDGGFLVANLRSPGGVWKIDRSGAYLPFVMEASGRELIAVNFVRLDYQGRVWICANPQVEADGRYGTEERRGFIVLSDGSGTRIVADGIGWANECVVVQSGTCLFVNETFARRVTAFDVSPGGNLSNRRTVCEFGHGTFPDGLAMDAEGALWVVSIASNRLIRIRQDGHQHVVLSDENAEHLARLEDAYRRNRLTRELLTSGIGAKFRNLTSIAFGGPDLRTAYLGSIGGDQIAVFRSPVAGLSPAHWHW